MIPPLAPEFGKQDVVNVVGVLGHDPGREGSHVFVGGVDPANSGKASSKAFLKDPWQ